MNDDKPSTEELGFLLGDVYRLLRQEFERRADAVGLTMTQWRAIALLNRDPGMQQSALATALEVSPITLTRLIDRMEKAGWVQRHPDPDDRRAVRLQLTEAVKPLLDTLHEKAAETRELALTGMSDTARGRLLNSLRRVKANLRDAQARTEQGERP